MDGPVQPWQPRDGERLHLAGGSAHGYGDVLLGCRVQKGPVDGDDGAPGGGAPARLHGGRDGVLDEGGGISDPGPSGLHVL